MPLFRGLFFLICLQLALTSNGQIANSIYTFHEYNSGLVSVRNYFKFKDKYYYISSSSNTVLDLFQTNGAPSGTIKLTQGLQYLTLLGLNDNFMLFDSPGGTLLISNGGSLAPLSSSTNSPGGTIYFSRTGSNSSLTDLWVSDGTSSGTRMIIHDTSGQYIEFNGYIYFIKLYDNNLYRFKDGVTEFVGNIGANMGAQILGKTTTKIFFNSDNQIWAASSTGVISIASSGTHFVYPYQVANEKLYFADATNNLNVTAGMVGDTKVVTTLPANFTIVYGVAMNSVVLSSGVLNTTTDAFIAMDFSKYRGNHTDPASPNFYLFADSACHVILYKFNSTNLTKTKVADLVGYHGVDTDFGQSFGNTLLFSLNDRFHGAEVWASDGTKAGTKMLRDEVTTQAATSTIYWNKGKSEYYFYVSTSTDNHYTDLWSLDSATNVAKSIYSFCSSNLPPPSVVFKNDLYFADNRQLLRMDHSTKQITSVLSKPNLDPSHILAGTNQICFGASIPNFDLTERVFTSHDGQTFDSLGVFPLSSATITVDGLYQVSRTADSVYLYLFSGNTSPKKIKGLGLSQNVFQTSLQSIGKGLLISLTLSNNDVQSFYFDESGIHNIESTLGTNGYQHYHDIIAKDDSIFYKVIDLSGTSTYFFYAHGLSAPKLLATVKNGSSNLIEAGDGYFYYFVNNEIMKLNLASMRIDTLHYFKSLGYKEIGGSDRKGHAIVFHDNSFYWYYIHSTKNIFLGLGPTIDPPFLVSDEIIYYSASNSIWQINPSVLVTEVSPYSENSLCVYPNPTKENISFSSESSGEIFSLAGQSLLNFSNSSSIDISSLAPGLYIIKMITASGKLFTGKIVKSAD